MDQVQQGHQIVRENLVNEILKLLDHHSWSEDLINLAEENIGLNKGYRYIVFPGGLKEIICFFENQLDKKMLESLAHIGSPQKVRDKIALALETRIMSVIAKKAAITSAGYYLFPGNIFTSSEAACSTCDIIWKYAGDKSVDFNYYTKRGLLISVYLASWTFYFGDKSANHQDTKKFIKNALDNIINIASFKNNIKFPKMEDIPIIRLFS